MTEVESSTVKTMGENSEMASVILSNEDKHMPTKNSSSLLTEINDDDRKIELQSMDTDINCSTTEDTSALTAENSAKTRKIPGDSKKMHANEVENTCNDIENNDVPEDPNMKKDNIITLNDEQQKNHAEAINKNNDYEEENNAIEDNNTTTAKGCNSETTINIADNDCNTKKNEHIDGDAESQIKIEAINNIVDKKETKNDQNDDIGISENKNQENGFTGDEELLTSANNSVVLVADDSDVEMSKVSNTVAESIESNASHDRNDNYNKDEQDENDDDDGDLSTTKTPGSPDINPIKLNEMTTGVETATATPTATTKTKSAELEHLQEKHDLELVKEATAISPNKSVSICSDSDGAVIINSDSEPEMSTTENSKNNNKIFLSSSVNQQKDAQLLQQHSPMSTANNNNNTDMKNMSVERPQIIDDDKDDDDDDDDDDCVVIEDDAPASININKRKKTDDLNDVSINKRQRTNASSPLSISLGGIKPFTINDARNLINQNQVSLTASTSSTPASVATSATLSNNNATITSVPQLEPSSVLTTAVTVAAVASVAAAVTAANMTSIPALMASIPGLTSNTTLLPGLTDDMYVLEAPSFIVPYIYEKPPAESLKSVCKEIEQRFKLSKEDLAEADKSDEFDMMTEQNKEEKIALNANEKVETKKKRTRGGDDPDESWSEGFEEDDEYDDDDDSDTGVRTKVLIKEANDDLTALKGAIKSISSVAQSTDNTQTIKSGQENYFESPLGKFFMDIGVGLVQEHVQSDLIRLQKRKMRKSLSKNLYEFERAIAALNSNLEASKKKNEPFKFTLKRCEFCNFKSESALSMANHYETPHMNGIMYKCNFCSYEIRNATEIVYHMEAMHNIKARLIKPLPYHQCPNCGFEDNGKAKLARHQPVCAKKFRPEINLSPPADWEAPAKIPRIKPRHGLVGTATAYQAMAAQAAAQKAALASIQQQQQQHVAQARNLQAAALAAQNSNKIRGRPPSVSISKTNIAMLPNNNTIITPNILRGSTPLLRVSANSNLAMPNNYLAGAQLLQQTPQNVKKPVSGQPSISITPLPRQNVNAQQTNTSGLNNNSSSTGSNGKLVPQGAKASGAVPGANNFSNNKAQYVICEICDGYIKDLDQLRNHMQWMHKVKIHPKMIYNRPPLNCQKCQFRFFTDQGLERHLLGSHGLVTSSMQEAANKAKDAGRCPVCGRMYQWNLLNHVSREHHMTLKPAHLSYKCTVCTATFGMYKQFETHVYTAHSTVAKKAMDCKKNNSATTLSVTSPLTGTSNSSSGKSNNLTTGTNATIVSTGSRSLSATNDALLKPLKINDEITIIPQPANKTRIENIESHVID